MINTILTKDPKYKSTLCWLIGRTDIGFEGQGQNELNVQEYEQLTVIITSMEWLCVLRQETEPYWKSTNHTLSI